MTENIKETQVPLEQRLVQAFQEKMNSGIIEEMVEKHAEKAIQEAMNDAFKSYGGGLGDVIEKKFKEILTPMIEGYNYAEHLVKLETVLNEIITQAAQPNKELLGNFKQLMTAPLEEVTVTELFKHYAKFVAREFETDGREISFDDRDPEYEPVEVSVYFEEKTESYSWSSTKYGQLVFEVTEGIDNEDELKKLNFIVPLMKSSSTREDHWIIQSFGAVEISNLRYMDEFEVLLRSMNQTYTKIKIDNEEVSDTVYSDNKPEATFE